MTCGRCTGPTPRSTLGRWSSTGGNDRGGSLSSSHTLSLSLSRSISLPLSIFSLSLVFLSGFFLLWSRPDHRHAGRRPYGDTGIGANCSHLINILSRGGSSISTSNIGARSIVSPDTRPVPFRPFRGYIRNIFLARILPRWLCGADASVKRSAAWTMLQTLGMRESMGNAPR